MNAEKPKRKDLYRIIIILVVVAIVTYLIQPSTRQKIRFLTMTTQERMEDTSENKTIVKEDSVQLVSGKVSESEFQSDYTAESWMAKFKANSIAFNEKYSGVKIDVVGRIKEISMSLSDHSLIKLDTGEGSTDEIICLNVKKNDKDGWRNEVKTVVVGDNVHITGVYDFYALDPDNMHLEYCHIVQ